jgi:hypothetical protein
MLAGFVLITYPKYGGWWRRLKDWLKSRSR